MFILISVFVSAESIRFDSSQPVKERGVAIEFPEFAISASINSISTRRSLIVFFIRRVPLFPGSSKVLKGVAGFFILISVFWGRRDRGTRLDSSQGIKERGVAIEFPEFAISTSINSIATRRSLIVCDEPSRIRLFF